MTIAKNILFSLIFLSTSGICAMTTTEKIVNGSKAALTQAKIATIKTLRDPWTYGPAAAVLAASIVPYCLEGKLDRASLYKCMEIPGLMLAISTTGNFIRNAIPEKSFEKIPAGFQQCLKAPLAISFFAFFGVAAFNTYKKSIQNNINQIITHIK